MPKENPPVTESYLGDGLYASFDGFQITLRAPRSEGDHWVGLEPSVMREFMNFAKACGMITASDPSCRHNVPFSKYCDQCEKEMHPEPAQCGPRAGND